MDERFLLEVNYKGELLKYDAGLRILGYTYRFEVDLDNTLVLFEPDEEGNYRALVSAEQINAKGSNLEIGLLQAIAEKLDSLHTS